MAAPYTPRDEAELTDFETRWCANCVNDNADVGDYCEMLCLFYGGEQPQEWTFLNGKRNCSAFTSIDGSAAPDDRCPFTMEMF